MMDSSLLDLVANRVLVGPAVPEDQLSELKSRFRGEESRLRDYYVVAKIHAPYAVLFCFEQNFAWGSKVRQRYAQMLAGLAVLWVLIGMIIGSSPECGCRHSSAVGSYRRWVYCCCRAEAR
jgi:hypothetical protein